MISRIVLALVGLLSTPVFCQHAFVDPAALGRITGTVLGENGQLMDHTRVCVWTMRTTSTGSGFSGDCTLLTDHLGKFQIDHVKNGTYRLNAEKLEEGYKAISPSGELIPVSEANPLHVITIKLGPPGGIVTCLVTDRVTGKPIEPQKPTFTERVVIGGSSYPMKASFQAVVPAEADLSIKATARGYRDWSYRNPSDPNQSVLRMAHGERRVLKIEMEPVPTPKSTPP